MSGDWGAAILAAITILAVFGVGWGIGLEHGYKMGVEDPDFDAAREAIEESEGQVSEFIPGKTLVHVSGQCFDAEEAAALRGLADDPNFQPAAGWHAAQLEKNLAKRFGVKHALLVNSGSSANLIALASLGLPKGSR